MALPLRLSLSAIFLALSYFLGFVLERPQFAAFLLSYGLFFAVYLWIVFRGSTADRHWWLATGIALRLLLLFSLPNLSDDFYRFLWDGRLLAHGLHPFAHPPRFFMENGIALRGIDADLFARLNSPDYHTVYPPVCQAVFWLSAKLFPEHITGGVFVLKAFLFCCELATLALLAAWERTTAEPRPLRKMPAAVWYALNPLVVLEICGNAHFEGALICFLLAGLLALQRGQLSRAAFFWALATASKLLPLLFLPIVWVILGWRRGGCFALWFALFSACFFAPLLQPEIWTNMASSLNLYFRQFAFNASVYYVLKMAGKAVAAPGTEVGRMLGPILGLAVFAGVWVLALANLPGRSFKKKTGEVWRKALPPPVFFLKFRLDRFLAAATLYLALATTVHPWYATVPFALSLSTPWRYPLVWTGVVALSYSHYQGGAYREQYGWIALEYVLLFGFAAWECYHLRRGRAVVTQVEK